MRSRDEVVREAVRSFAQRSAVLMSIVAGLMGWLLLLGIWNLSVEDMARGGAAGVAFLFALYFLDMAERQ